MRMIEFKRNRRRAGGVEEEIEVEKSNGGGRDGAEWRDGAARGLAR